jgi:glycosyltransferase involved in cell wall biosynthesis
MTKRRVMILCYFFPPLAGGGVHRVLSFARYLPANGWDCTVVCAGEHDYWVTDSSLAAEVPAATEVIRVAGGSALSALLRVTRATPGRRSGRAFGSLRRLSDWWLLPDSYIGWARRATQAASRRIAAGGIDVVLSSSPPDSVHLAARALQRRHRLPWVADFRDPWIALSFRTPPSAWHRARQAALEREVLEHADAVQVASTTHRRTLGHASGAQIDGARVTHLPNGWEDASSPFVTTASSQVDRAAAAGGSVAAPAERFTLVWTGTLSQMPDTDVFLEAVHEVLKRQPAARRTLRARLAGPFESWHADRAVALGLTGIVDFPGPLPHADSRALQRGADALLLWKPRGAPTMVPGKLYEYLAAGRPILAVLPAEDEAAELARRGGAVVTAPGDREALAAEIERRWLVWKEGVRPAPMRPEWLDDFRRDRLAARLAATLTHVAEARR